MDHHHADVKTASKVRFAEPGAGGDQVPNHADDAPSPPLTDSEDKEKDDKVKSVNSLVWLCGGFIANFEDVFAFEK